MAITAVDKIKINKYIKEHAVGKMYYTRLCEALGKREKISDIEFLEYFTNCVIEEFRKDGKISTKHIVKVLHIVMYFIKRVNENNIDVNEQILDKIRNFNNFYHEYIDKTKADKELDDSIVDILNDIDEYINELYPIETKRDSLVEYINKIAELEIEIKELKKKLTSSTKSSNKLQASCNQMTDKINSLNTEIGCLEQGVQDKDSQIIELNNTIKSLKRRIVELQSTLLKSEEQISCLELYKEKCESLIQEVEELRKVIADDALEKTKLHNIELKNSEMETLIYRKLLLEGVSIDEILKYLHENGYTSSREEVFNLLKKLKKTFNIDDTQFCMNPIYKISSPNILENGQFTVNIPNNFKYYDIMLVSDFHLKSIDDDTLKNLDLLNEYCLKNGIKLILNLGDFYDGSYDETLDDDIPMKSYKNIEEIISLFPKADGIYHAILGGNHDKSILTYGFDPIDVLAKEREDIINLGYTHSTILLNKSSHRIGSFDIHHPDTFDFPIHLTTNGIDMEYLDTYLNDIYLNQGKNRDSSYIDIFGHTHKSQFNYISGCCYIPSYLEGKKKGACHLRIYIDDISHIKYMVFMPLTLDSKLYKNNEIIYQKILSK